MRWKSRFFDFSTERLFNNFFARGSFQNRCSLAGVMTQPLRSIGDAQRSIEMLMDHYVASCQCPSPAHLVDLQVQALEADGVIAVHCALEPKREDQVQIPSPAGCKSTALLGCENLKTAIELGDILLAQKPVSFRYRADAPQPEFLG